MDLSGLPGHPFSTSAHRACDVQLGYCRTAAGQDEGT